VTHRRRLIRQPGFTLIEMMLALLLSLFLMGGILQVFEHSKKTYRTQEALSRLQENGRFAMEFLTRDLRMAGFMGCSNQAALTNTLKTPGNFFYRFDKAIEGFEASSASAWTPVLPTGNPAAFPTPLAGSDIISLRRVADQSFTVTAHLAATDNLKLDSLASTQNLKSAGFLKADGSNNCTLAAVSDCSSAAIFQVTGITGTTLSHATNGSCTPQNITTDLGKPYVNGQIWPVNTISYYLKKNPGKQPSLYQKIDANNAEELVEGIEKMQILYGVDTNPSPDATPNYYVNAAMVTDWNKVRSVRISLLVISLEDNLTDKPVTYTYNNITTPGDRHLRKVFTSTIALRNQIP
jgi:type IV pilus assembly protein PilW